MAQPTKPAGPAPGPTQLRARALRHLARFATTEAGLARVLDRAVQRWTHAAAAEGQDVAAAVLAARAAIPGIAASLAEAGLIDDAAFAAARIARLARGGRSRRAAAAHLAAKGVSPSLVASALPEDELPSALAYAKRRRLGPFRTEASGHDVARDLAALARAGFPRDVAERVLTMNVEAATAMVLELRRG